jgi:energy-coupling factor transporter ATP-binding protein EcfA2
MNLMNMVSKTQHSTTGPARLILFAGHAGTGKTTLAKKALPIIIERTGQDFFFLDKDTVYGQYSAQVMKLLTGNPNDRDSPFYLNNLRDLEYSGLIDIVRENLALNINVLLVGPFSREIQSGKIFNPKALGIPENTHIQIAWIDLGNEEAKKRMEKRADLRDEWKLSHWEEYLKRRVEPPTHSHIHRFDNSDANKLNFDQDFNVLVENLIT